MRRTAVSFLGFALVLGCREQSTSSPTPAPAPTAAGVITTNGKLVEVSRTGAALRRIEDVQTKFRVTKSAKKTGAPYAVMPPSEVTEFVAAGDRSVVAVAPGRGVGSTVELPLDSDAAMRIASGGLTVAAKPLGLTRQAAEFAQKTAVYAGVSNDTNLYRRVDHAGAEDFFHVSTARDRISYAYDVALTNVAGLRLVGGSLEMLDASGTPRLATTAPTVIDSKGVRRTGTLSVRGCEYDSDPSGPWGRAVTAPGNDHCQVVYDVDTRGLAFPVLFDPAWFATDDMLQARAWHHLVQLPAGAKDGGKILAVGGSGGAPLTTMLYDTATGTWAGSSSLNETHGEGANVVLFSDGTVLVAGGLADTGTGAKTTVELRNKTTGSWSYAAAMGGRAYFAAGLIKVGGVERAIVAGGYASTSSSAKGLKTAQVYDPATNKWTATPALSAERGKVEGAVLTDGRFLLVGGETNGSFSATAQSTTEVYNPATNTWASAGTLTDGRSSHIVVALPGGKALTAAGGDGSGYTQFDSIEYWNGTSTWSTATAKLTETKQDAVAATLSDGRIMIAGGWYAPFSGSDITTATTDLIDLGATPPGTLKVVGSGAMRTARSSGAAVSLGLKVLVSGGYEDHTVTTETPAAEIFDASIGKACGTGCPAGLFCTDGVCCKTASCGTGETCAAPGFEGICTKPKGATCASNSECGTGFCVTGVCCETACKGSCQTCSAVPGKCTPVVSAEDPDTCALGKVCDAASTCRTNLGQECKTGADCASGTCAEGVCCDRTCGGACETCASPLGHCTARRARSVGSPTCAPFACDGASATCPTACTTDSACPGGARCDVTNGRCVVGGYCIDTRTLGGVGPDPTSCAPYTCDSSACRTTCRDVHDCAFPAVCNEAGACVSSTSEAAAADAGCSASPALPDRHGALAIFFGAALSLVVRRRRRAQSS
jgi:hypothetical protein